ncbi:cell wall surface anchor family protein [gut metagenome]|uniref:Cell wall surface anchor family protein n=1 Tax=gut metagenome TaxID=749906 RepID=J9FYF9_9ZZZZ
MSNTELTALPLGTIKIKEVEAPPGYAINGKEIEIQLREQKDNKGQFTIQEAALSQPNLVILEKTSKDFWRVRVQAKKIDGNGKGLAGAEFKVYDNENCIGQSVANLVSKDDGTTNIEKIDQIPQTVETLDLWCKEVKAPAGYARLTTPIKLTFTLADFKKLSAAEQKKGELKIFGVTGGGNGIVNKKGWPVRVNAKKVDEKGKGLAGAVFEVFGDADCTDYIGELKSTADGTTNILSTSFGDDVTTATLYCREKTPPQGYSKTDTVYTLEFTKAEYEAQSNKEAS